MKILVRIWVTLLVCFGLVGTAPAQGQDKDQTASWEGIVSATKLNVRARPGLKYEAVFQLNKGDKVMVFTHEGDWLGMEAPQDATAWVPSASLEGKVVGTDGATIYAGPGTYFSQMGRLGQELW